MPTSTSPATPLPQNTIHDPPPYPPIPPSLLDILPPLHDLLARLLIPAPSTSATSPNGSPPNNNINNASSFSPPPTSLPDPSSSSTSSSQHLPIKDLATAASGIKMRVSKAKELVAKGGIPGGEMSIWEQDALIKGLTEEVGRLEAVVRGRGEMGMKVVEGFERRGDGDAEVVGDEKMDTA